MSEFSKETLRKVRPHLPRLEAITLAAFRQGPATANAAAERCVEALPHIVAESCRKRIYMLRRKKLIVQTGVVTEKHRSAAVYQLTEKGRQQLQTEVDQTCHIRGENTPNQKENHDRNETRGLAGSQEETNRSQ